MDTLSEFLTSKDDSDDGHREICTRLLFFLLQLAQLAASAREATQRASKRARNVSTSEAHQPITAQQTGRCKTLRYSNRRQSSAPSAAPPLIRDYRNRPFDTSDMPVSIPEELRDMRREDNRLESFRLPGASFTAANLVSVEELAASGFYYLQEADRVKCAFCRGVLGNWEPGEQPREAHGRHFGTCPLLLALEVGNVPRRNTDAHVRPSVQCTEPTSDDAQLLLTSRGAAAGDGSRRDELISLGLMERPQLPVSSAVARAACSEAALTNLSALQTRLQQLEPSSVTVKHPDFASFNARLKSLQSALAPQPAFLLAKAGFFYSSDQRTTCCFSCGLEFTRWTCDDNVWLQHARWSPRCPHVLLEQGCDFVRSVHRLVPPVQAPAAGNIATAAPQPQAALFGNHSVSLALAVTPGVEFRVEAGDLKVRSDLPAVRLLSQLGFSAQQVRLLAELHLRLGGDDFASGELFIDFVLRGCSGAQEFERRMAQMRQRGSQPSPRPRCRSIDWKTCKVCWDKEVNLVLLACGHVACCSVCAKSLKNCPVCEAFIWGTLVLRD